MNSRGGRRESIQRCPHSDAVVNPRLSEANGASAVTWGRTLHQIRGTINQNPIMKSIRYLALALGLVSIPVFAQKVTDAQIAAIVVAANQVDIDAGKFAADKSTDANVQGFAKTMVTDHSAVNKSAVELVTKLHVTPEANDTSRALTDGGEKNLSTLRGLDGKAFDKAYVDHEVAYHEQVIAALDTVLIPNAENAELKALLVKVRPAFIAHLGHAKHLQATYR